MAAEIERKFRLSRAPAWLATREADEIEQGYLAFSERGEVRLRQRGRERMLTVKRGSGEVREEIEVPLGVGGFERLWALTEGARLAKRRHLVALEDGLAAEVDVYAGALEGLVVAEVEFDSQQASRSFQPPAWFGREVTGDDRYANRSLALGGAVPDDAGVAQSRSYRLKRKERPAAGARRIALGRLAKASERLRSAERGEDVAAAVHGTRKDLKKLRALLRLVRDELGEKTYRRENRRYREAGRALAGARDARVKAETLDSLLGGARFDAATLQVAASWRRALEREDQEASERLRDGEAVAAALELLRGADAQVEGWSLSRSSWSPVSPGLTRAYERGRKEMRRARGGDPEAVHQWRKRAKDLWYQQRLLRTAWPEEMKVAAARTHILTELLGDHHDLSVLAEDLRSRELPKIETKALEAAIAAAQKQLLDEALGLGAHLYVEKPKAFHSRMRGHWKAR